MILLLIRRMSAAFGRLHNHTLELGDGLNILQAPNETGKSTWCAFLLAMLYGINSKERDRAGFIAEKNRYAPWSGAAMQGRLDCLYEDQELTLTRTTRRQTAPMGEFSAVYTGTGTAAAGLTGQNCGETLLGVTREVYERSAFIRQSGLSITQDAGLERRIAALISSGEEDTSFSEAMDALKKQLNRRRHNRTGQLPLLEAEATEIDRQLADLEDLQVQLRDIALEAEQLATREQQLQAELAAHQRWEAQLRRQALAQAALTAQNAETRLDTLRQQLEHDRVPETDAIGRLRGAIVNLETVRKSVEKARSERDEAMKALLRAEAAVNESPFAGQTAESARKEAQRPLSDWNSNRIFLQELAIFFVGVALAIAAAFGVMALQGPSSTSLHLFLPFLPFVAVTAAGGCLSRLYRRRCLEKARSAALLKRFDTDDSEAIAALAEAYAQALEARDAAQGDVSAKTATADALYASLTSNEQGILLEVRRFAPAAFDIPAADAALKDVYSRRRELSAAESAAREARLRQELLARQTAELPQEDAPAEEPSRPQEAVAQELDRVRAALAAARSRQDQLSGLRQAVGDPAVLADRRAALAAQLQTLEAEYAAIQLAMDALESANTTLQNRFSPALGRRAAEFFHDLTGGRYSGVALDRSLHLSAEPTGDSVYRDAQLLSAGAADQLYLAVRLAICDLVLPQDRAVPIVLDDALTAFDDARCADALRLLKEESRKRQILLFTCHSREADFFAGDGEVFVQRLTEQPKEV